MLLALWLWFASPSFAPNTSPKDHSISLQDFIDGSKAPPFACSFGRYKVHLRGQQEGQFLATLEGKGVLVNSGWIHLGIKEPGSGIFRFPLGTHPLEGSYVLGLCYRDSTGGYPTIEYLIPEIT